MIAMTAQGIARFFLNPVEALARMRAVTPGLQAAILALSAATIIMVLIDLAYGPHAFPHSVQPGGKRDFAVYTLTYVELARAFAIASILLIGSRHIYKSYLSVAEAIWMTVPFAVALVGFELIQMGTWLFAIFSGIDLYGQFFIMGFLGAILVLVVSVRALASDKDWLAVLPLAAGSFLVAYYFAPFVLMVTAIYLIFHKQR